MTVAPLVAYRGDNFDSPHWAVFINNMPVTPSEWHVRAVARKNAASEVVFAWSSTPGVGVGSIEFGSAEVKRKDGSVATTGTVQLQLRPADWTESIPSNWSGVIDVEFSSDNTATPAHRHTVIRKRAFKIEGDVAT